MHLAELFGTSIKEIARELRFVGQKLVKPLRFKFGRTDPCTAVGVGLGERTCFVCLCARELYRGRSVVRTKESWASQAAGVECSAALFLARLRAKACFQVRVLCVSCAPGRSEQSLAKKPPTAELLARMGAQLPKAVESTVVESQSSDAWLKQVGLQLWASGCTITLRVLLMRSGVE